MFAAVIRLGMIQINLWCHYVEASFDVAWTNPDEAGRAEGRGQFKAFQFSVFSRLTKKRFCTNILAS